MKIYKDNEKNNILNYLKQNAAFNVELICYIENQEPNDISIHVWPDYNKINTVLLRVDNYFYLTSDNFDDINSVGGPLCQYRCRLVRRQIYEI